MALGTRTITLNANMLRTPASPQISIDVFKADPLKVILNVYEGVDIASLADVTSITFLVKETEFTTAALISQTKTVFTEPPAASGHCMFSFSDVECNLDLARGRKNEFYCVVYAIQNDGQKKTLAAGKLLMFWDGNPTNVGAAPVNPDYGLTRSLADLLYVGFMAAQTLTEEQQLQALENIGITIDSGGLMTLPGGYTIRLDKP